MWYSLNDERFHLLFYNSQIIFYFHGTLLLFDFIDNKRIQFCMAKEVQKRNIKF